MSSRSSDQRQNQTIFISTYQSITTLIPISQSSIQLTHIRGSNYFFYQRTETKVQTQLWEFIKSKLHPNRFVIPRNRALLFLSYIFQYHFSKFCLCWGSHAPCFSESDESALCTNTYADLSNLNNKIKGAHDIANTCTEFSFYHLGIFVSYFLRQRSSYSLEEMKFLSCFCRKKLTPVIRTGNISRGRRAACNIQHLIAKRNHGKSPDPATMYRTKYLGGN